MHLYVDIGDASSSLRGSTCSFCSFSIEDENENRKNILYILQEIFQEFQNCRCFYSSIKTEGVLFIYIYIFIYIYEKLSLKWKNFQEQVFFFFDFTSCVKISVRSDQ